MDTRPAGDVPGKWWGAGSGVSRAEVLHGVPLSGRGADISIAGSGRRHYSPECLQNMSSPRTKVEAIQGLPQTGTGVQISQLAARRHYAAPTSSPARPKIQELHGLPMHGGGADIALAGGRQHFPVACRECRGPQNETLADIHIRNTMQLVGRERQLVQRDQCRMLSSPSFDSDSVDQPTYSLCVHDGPHLPLQHSQHCYQFSDIARDLTQDVLLEEDEDDFENKPFDSYWGEMDNSTRSMASMAMTDCSTTSVSSVTSDLARSMDFARAVKTAVRTASTASLHSNPTVSPSANSDVGEVMDDMLREKMDSAWAAMCQMLEIPENQSSRTGRRGVGSRKVLTLGGYRPTQVAVEHPKQNYRQSQGQWNSWNTLDGPEQAEAGVLARVEEAIQEMEAEMKWDHDLDTVLAEGGGRVGYGRAGHARNISTGGIDPYWSTPRDIGGFSVEPLHAY